MTVLYMASARAAKAREALHGDLEGAPHFAPVGPDAPLRAQAVLLPTRRRPLRREGR